MSIEQPGTTDIGGAAPSAAQVPADTEAPQRALDPWLQRARRPYVWVSVLIVIALAVWWFAIRSDGTSASANGGVTFANELVTVTRGTISNTVSANGTVAASQTDNLNFTSAGTVTAVNVKAGDTVQTGQVLATLDSASVQAAVTAAQSTLANAQAKLSDDQSAGSSAAQVAADQTSVQSATDSLTSAQNSLAGASLVATFNGTVAVVNLTVGEQLGSGGSSGTGTTGSATGSGRSSSSIGSASNALGGNNSNNNSSSSQPQIQVVTQGSYTVSLPIASNDISNVVVGQPVTLTVTTASSNGFGGFGGFRRALAGAGVVPNVGAGGTASGGRGSGGTSAATGATATGKVTTVAQVASAASGVATYPVAVSFTAPSTDFYVGATVAGAIATNLRPNVLEVPTRAVTDDNGVATVVIATKGKVNGPTKTVRVGTGATANGMIEITSGLREGESVVVSTPQFTTPTTGTAGNSTTGNSPTGFGNQGSGAGTGRTTAGQ